MKQVEGMKSTPAGGANRAPFGKEQMPTNASIAVGKLGAMLNAIKHIGRPAKGGKKPFGK